MTNIIVVFRKIEDAKNIRAILARNGFSVTAICSAGIQAVSQIDNLKNGIVICGYQLADMYYTELHESLPPGFQMLLMARESVLPDLKDNGIVCLAMPTRVKALIDTVSMLQRTVEADIRKRKNKKLNRTGEEIAIINEAKALLMARNNMTEPEAHRYIQKSAMDTGTDFVETAQMVLDLFK